MFTFNIAFLGNAKMVDLNLMEKIKYTKFLKWFCMELSTKRLSQMCNQYSERRNNEVYSA